MASREPPGVKLGEASVKCKVRSGKCKERGTWEVVSWRCKMEVQSGRRQVRDAKQEDRSWRCKMANVKLEVSPTCRLRGVKHMENGNSQVHSERWLDIEGCQRKLYIERCKSNVRH